MQQNTIAFIGGGNMACSLIRGLLTAGMTGQQLRVADPDNKRLEIVKQLSSDIRTYEDNLQAISSAQIIVLAVKPQVMRAVIGSIAEATHASQPLIISIAAGIETSAIAQWFNADVPIVRCMPNTPALVNSGATGLYANALVSADQKDHAESLLRSVGSALWVDEEKQLDAVTALSGSGPAYHFLMIEAMQAAGEQLGLPAETARILSIETAFGAAKLALESQDDVAVLRQRVTSPGGTTEQALNTLEQDGFRALMAKAMQSAYDRAGELAKQLGKN